MGNMTATLQAVGMQKGIVQDSSKGKTTKKERRKEISLLLVLPGVHVL